MRRWNGWGSPQTNFPLSAEGAAFLKSTLGAGKKLADATLEQAISRVSDSRLAAFNGLSYMHTDKETRLRHARGQSLPDWLAMRAGKPEQVPDAVAFPQSRDEVKTLLTTAVQHNWLVIPYGGGTSVVGHINTPVSERPVVIISMEKMNQLLALDDISHLATIGAGANGPQVEKLLNEKGYTLGHFPQSWELSTLGGWVASRSSGQQSMRYGRIEQLFAGGHVETLHGVLKLPTLPATSAGPDLRQLVMGSEGRLGVITDVDVRITPLPEHESFHVAFAKNWEQAEALVRSLVQSRLPLSMLRLSNAIETYTQLVLAGHKSQVAWLERYLRLRGIGEGKCMITFGVTGAHKECKQLLNNTKARLRKAGAVYLGTLLGKKWEQARFRSPYLRHGLWEHGYAVDTLETCVDWVNVSGTMQQIEQAIHQAAPKGDKVHVFTHLSHLYTEGSSIYTTYVFKNQATYQATFEAWQAMKQAASDVITKQGGTISHQHGVGRDHAPWLEAEKTALGIKTLEHLMHFYDPDQQLNPGALLLNRESNDN